MQAGEVTRAAPAAPVRKKKKVGATEAPPQDTLAAPVQRTERIADLRAIAASVQPRQEKVVDPNELPFGVELEIEAEDGTHWFNTHSLRYDLMGADLQPWNLHPKCQTWRIEPDDSLTKDHSAEAVSPVMNLKTPGVGSKSKAREEIERILETAKALKGHTTARCGLHIHVDAKALGEAGLSNLFKIALENERLLFKLAQNGQATHRGLLPGLGFRHGIPYYYSRPFAPFIADPFPLLHAGSPQEMGRALYTVVPEDPKHPRQPLPADMQNFKPDRRDSVRYFGINFNSYWYQGTIEFRLFNASDDPDDVMATVELCLGMVKAAAEGNYAYLRPQGLDPQAPNQPVSAESMEYFLNQVCWQPGMKERWTTAFEKSGGVVEPDAPVSDPAVLQAASALQSGQRFFAQGHALTSPFEIAHELAAGKRKVIVE